jgi:hypothetical protein
MWIWKGDSRKLSFGMSGVQESNRETKKGCRKRKDADGRTIRRSEDTLEYFKKTNRLDMK